MMLFEFFSSLSYVLSMCSVPSFHQRTCTFSTVFINELNFWWAFARHRVKFAENLFPECSSSYSCSEPSHLQYFFFCASIFLLRFFLYFACLFSFSIWNIDSGEKFTTLLFQVANHSTIAFKIFFIFPYDLEKVSVRFKLLAKDNEKDSFFVKLIYK